MTRIMGSAIEAPGTAPRRGGVDLLGLFPAAGVELRICRSLTPLAHAVVASTLHFSLIRMRNAEGWGG